MKVICSWCNLVLRDGTLPASHGLCDRCSNALHAEMDAKRPPISDVERRIEEAARLRRCA